MKAVRTGPEEIVVIHTNGPNGVVVEHFRRADVMNLSDEAVKEITNSAAAVELARGENPEKKD